MVSSSGEEELQRAINEKVEIRDYDPQWPSLFEAERRRLQALCGDKLTGIEHVGSTAVPGLSAKPIIDIIAAVNSLQDADELLIVLCVNGYTTSVEFNASLVDKRWLMRQQNGRRTHHLHLLLPTSEEWSKKVRFRDILQQDPAVRQAYVSLKHQLANELSCDREAYTDAKSEFIQAVLCAG